jgi:hypothetical protein
MKRTLITFLAWSALAMVATTGVMVGCTEDAIVVDGSDGSADDGNNAGDGKSDGSLTDGGSGGKREGGNCTPVRGTACDLVLQDCPDDNGGKKQECIATRTSSGVRSTQCVPVQPSQQLPMGHTCCPGQDNPCLPGLICVGDECADGGAQTARCSPICCEGDHPSCGQSDPEGIGGQCDLIIVDNDGGELFNVCSYRERCKPFKVEPCKANQLCIVEDKLGTAGCLSSNGKKLRQPCGFANDCEDGLICVGGICRMYCLTPNSNPPFDAGAATGGPGRGGCPANETCTGPTFQNLPDWLQLCVLADGG